jgi:putative endonuclease
MDAVHFFARQINLPHTVYILHTGDGHTYVGRTCELDERLRRHQAGKVHYTIDKLPVLCVAAFGFMNKYETFALS